MSNLVDPSSIERIVGLNRHPTVHLGRVVTAEDTVYIMHSEACVVDTPDLRDCPYSIALDKGVDVDRWDRDVPAVLWIKDGRLEQGARFFKEATASG